jgi:hypothetical protein
MVVYLYMEEETARQKAFGSRRCKGCGNAEITPEEGYVDTD